MVFKIEPLLRRNAPSVELSAQVALNSARAAILAEIIKREDTVLHEEENPSCVRPLDDCRSVPPGLRKYQLSDTISLSSVQY